MPHADLVDRGLESGNVTQTIMRGLEVLRAFRCEPRPLSNGELAARSGLSKATISRITSTLVSLGYLLRIPSSGRFQLGPAILGFGQVYLGGSQIRALARPFMERLAIKMNVSVGLAIADRLEMLYILWCRSRSTMTLRLSAGSVLPMGFSAIGKAYLASQQSDRRRKLMLQLRRQAGDRAPALVQDVEAGTREYQRYGYCSAFDGVQKNTFGIAVPIVYGHGRDTLALSCGGAQLRMNKLDLRRNIAPALLRTADEIGELAADLES
jgi:DNA-binding IclR family transcriptional regulator